VELGESPVADGVLTLAPAEGSRDATRSPPWSSARTASGARPPSRPCAWWRGRVCWGV